MLVEDLFLIFAVIALLSFSFVLFEGILILLLRVLRRFRPRHPWTRFLP